MTLSFETDKFIWATAFSHHLGLKHCRKTKIEADLPFIKVGGLKKNSAAWPVGGSWTRTRLSGRMFFYFQL